MFFSSPVNSVFSVFFCQNFEAKKFKHDKEGLKGRFKILGQIGLGIIVGLTLFFHSDVTIKEQIPMQQRTVVSSVQGMSQQFYPESKSTKTTIPFVKANEFDYADLITWIHPNLEKHAWIVFVLVVISVNPLVRQRTMAHRD